MKRKVLASILMLALTAGMIAGCGKKEVEYGAENTEGGSTGSLAQYKDAKNWTDEWKVTDADGLEQTLTVDAEIIVPDIDRISVIEVNEAGLDAEYKEQFLKAFFENGDIYYADEIHYPKERVEQIIAMFEELLQDPLAAEDEEYYRLNEEAYQAYLSMRETAPDDYVMAEEFESSTNYGGYRGDIWREVTFNEELGYVGVYGEILTPLEGYEPKSLSKYETIERMENYKGDTDSLVNECQYSMEEAKGLAEAFLTKIGRSHQVCDKEENLMWHGTNGGSSGDAYVTYGYIFTYGTGIDGMNFSKFPQFYNFDTTWKEESMEDNLSNGDSITITVTDEGVVDVELDSPMVIRSKTDGVELLPLDTVQDIIEEELTQNIGKYDFRFDSESEFNQLQLMYLKMSEGTDEGVYSYIPVWCLSRYGGENEYYHPVFVNAIDGNIMYIEDFLGK